MKLLQNTRVTMKTLACSLCCWLQRVRSDKLDKTDSKIRSHKLISVFFICSPPPFEASVYSQEHIFVFFSQKSAVKKGKRGKE